MRKLYGDDPRQRNCMKLHSEKLFCVFSFLDRLANIASSVTDNQEGPTDDDETSEYTPPEAGGFK